MWLYEVFDGINPEEGTKYFRLKRDALEYYNLDPCCREVDKIRLEQSLYGGWIGLILRILNKRGFIFERIRIKSFAPKPEAPEEEEDYERWKIDQEAKDERD